MNFFTKNRFVSWLLIFLVIVNLSVLVTFMVFYLRKGGEPVQRACKDSCMTFSKELSLSHAQSAKVEAILSGYRGSTEPIAAGIRNSRSLLLEELAKEKPDTMVLNRCTDEIILYQRQMQKASVNQYLALKGICTREQCLRLSSLYFELYGCQGRGKGMGKGKGMMNRCGNGQGR